LTASATGLTNAVSSFFSVGAGAFSGLQLLTPGETAAPGTLVGKTGTPSAQTAGTAFNVTVNAVDVYWNLVNGITDTVNVSSSDGNATLPANAGLTAGTKTFAVTLRTAGSATLTASDITDNSRTASTSPGIAVNKGLFAKLQLLAPGETPVPGSATGKSGTPTAQSAGGAFSLTVNAVDANWNLINTATDIVSIASSDGNAILPANGSLLAGTRSFGLTFKTAGSNTVTARDVTDSTKTANTSPAIAVNPGIFAKLQV